MYSSKHDDWEAYLISGLPTICLDGKTELRVSRTCKELTKYIQSRNIELPAHDSKEDVTNQMKSEPPDATLRNIKQEIPDSMDLF